MTLSPTCESARAVSTAWGGCIGTPRLVARRENAVFEVRLARGCRAALRFHRPGYLDPAAIETELAWTDALAAAGIACPRPLRTDAGGW